MAGPAAGHGTVFLSATRFCYGHMRHMPFVIWHGLRLRSGWGAVEGAVGMYSGASLRTCTTYTVSAWTSPEALSRWLRSPAHAALMRGFRPHLADSSSLRWTTEQFEPRAAWREGMARLAACHLG